MSSVSNNPSLFGEQSQTYSQRAAARPIIHRAQDGKLRQSFVSEIAVNEVKSAHARITLDRLANRLLAQDTFVLLESAHVSPIKQARAMRARASRFGGSGGPVGGGGDDDDDDDGGGGGGFGGVALAFPSGMRVGPDAANLLGRGAKLRISPIRSRDTVPTTSIFNAASISGGGSSSSGTSSNNNNNLARSQSSPSSSPASMMMTVRRSPPPRRRVQYLAPLGTRHSAALLARKPILDTNIDDISSALIEWRAPTRLYVWGGGSSGQLGIGAFQGRSAVQRTAYPMRVTLGAKMMTSGGSTEDQDDETGGLEGGGGGGATNPNDIARGIVQVTPIRASCGKTISAFIDNARKVWVTGDGWLGRGVYERYHAPVLIDGNVVGGSGGKGGAAATSLTAVAEVACGHGFFVACTVDGAVFVWGENLTLAALGAVDKEFRRDGLGVGRKQAAATTTTTTSPSSSSGGVGVSDAQHFGHPLGLAAGELPRVTVPKQVPRLPEAIISVAAGEGHIVALSATGVVYTWGAGTSGACGHGTLDHVWAPKAITLRPRFLHDPTSMQYGQQHHRRDDTNGDDGMSVRRGSMGSIMSSPSMMSTKPLKSGLKSPNNNMSRVSPTTNNKNTSSSPGGRGTRSTAAEESHGICAISAGAHHTAVLALDGTVHVFGFAEGGRLGLGIDKAIAVSKPVQIRGMPTIVGVACGGAHSLFLSADGRVYACGDNTFGACGINTRIYKNGDGSSGAGNNSMRDDVDDEGGGVHPRVTAEAKVLVPRQIFTAAFGNVTVTKIMAGTRTSGAISTEGKMWCWGLNTEGGCGNGTDSSTPEPVRVARFRELRVVQASLGDTHGAAIVSRARATAVTTSIASLDVEDGGGGGATALEPPLSLKLKRAKRQQLNVRKKAITFAASVRRRQARKARRKALRKAVATTMTAAGASQYAQALQAAAAASYTGNEAEYQNGIAGRRNSSGYNPGGRRNSTNDYIPDGSFESSMMSNNNNNMDTDPRSQAAFSRRYASMAAKKRALGAWEFDIDDAEYGKNAAAFVVQTTFRKWIYKIKKSKRAHMVNLGLLSPQSNTHSQTSSRGGNSSARIEYYSSSSSSAAGSSSSSSSSSTAINRMNGHGTLSVRIPSSNAGSSNNNHSHNGNSHVAGGWGEEGMGGGGGYTPGGNYTSTRALQLSQLHALGFKPGGARAGTGGGYF